MSQFVQVRVEQVVSGLKHLGFFSVVEAALGADMVAYQEANELYEKGFLTSSCCPAFVTYVRKAFPGPCTARFAQPLPHGADCKAH